MRFRELRFLIRCDLYRYYGDVSPRSFVRNVVFTPGFKYSFWMRLSRYLRTSRLRFPLIYFCRVILDHYKYKYGISIPDTTQIAEGLYIGHFGGIVINEEAVIGKNCNLSQDVTLGRSNRGAREGAPVIGDNVYIGPGAKVIGRIKVGSHAAIGANCVVTKDVPDHAVVVGVPGRVISSEGSTGYINRTLT